MEDKLVKTILANPNYHKLLKARTAYGWWFTLLVMVVYYGFILLIAFKKEWLSTKLGDGVMTVGMPVGLFVIFFTVIITGIYVRRANSEFDDLTAKIKQEVSK